MQWFFSWLLHRAPLYSKIFALFYIITQIKTPRNNNRPHSGSFSELLKQQLLYLPALYLLPQAARFRSSSHLLSDRKIILSLSFNSNPIQAKYSLVYPSNWYTNVIKQWIHEKSSDQNSLSFPEFMLRPILCFTWNKTADKRKQVHSEQQTKEKTLL